MQIQSFQDQDVSSFPSGLSRHRIPALSFLAWGVVSVTLAVNAFGQDIDRAAVSANSVVAPFEEPTGLGLCQPLSGTWRGGWESCVNGHRGRLSATFCRLDDRHIKATFRGTFARIVPFRYPAVLTVVEEGPGYMRLRGSRRLGPMLGSFQYDAVITNDSFRATYSSCRDQGQWWLERCAPCR